MPQLHNQTNQGIIDRLLTKIRNELYIYGMIYNFLYLQMLYVYRELTRKPVQHLGVAYTQVEKLYSILFLLENFLEVLTRLLQVNW